MMIRVLIAAAFALPVASAVAEPASPWVRDGESALRLVDAGEGPDGARLAGVAIRLAPGWKTYWRQPGDSGVPPRFDFTRSTNVASAEVAFPVPERADDETGVTNVYHGEVTLPVVVRPKDPAAPATLALVADYGVCQAVCIPAHSEAVLELGPDGGFPGPAAAAVKRAAAKLPRRVALGEAHDGLAVASVRVVDGALEVTARAPGHAELFAETGQGDFVRAPEPVPPAADGAARFRIPLQGAPPASGVRLTLAAGGSGIEVLAPLDAMARGP